MIEKILERLEAEKEAYSDTTYYVYGLEAAKKIVQEVAKDGGWIPTADRLPTWDDYGKKYWVTIRCKETGYCQTRKMQWCIKHWAWNNGRWLSNEFEVIAWKEYEVPAPYQKGK